jgi:hypothetical protein
MAGEHNYEHIESIPDKRTRSKAIVDKAESNVDRRTQIKATGINYFTKRNTENNIHCIRPLST